MSLDTRDNRASALGMLKPYSFVLPNPDVAVEDQDNRQQLAFSYSGIQASVLYDIRPIIFTYADTRVRPAITASPELVPGILVAKKAMNPALSASAQMP